MTTPEDSNTPETKPNPLGKELAGKITDLMQHPKSDFMPETYRWVGK